MVDFSDSAAVGPEFLTRPGAARRRFLLTGAAALTVAATPTQDFQQFLAELRLEAAAQGVRTKTLDAAFKDLRPIEKIIQLDRAQPEVTVPFAEYLNRSITDFRVRTGKQRMAEHRALLAEIGTKYAVDPHVITALWGMETDFGANIGGFPVIGALATLAWNGRRALFRRELVAALQILDQGHVTLGQMKGSWAGAMGQAQFMPTSFAAYAVDQDGDGHKDIWRSTADVLASIGNYLKQAGWRAEVHWGVAVVLPADFAAQAVSLDVTKSVAEWELLGVRATTDKGLRPVGGSASIVQPGGAAGPSYLVTNNYRSIMRWNRSQKFATAIGLLADRLAGG